MPVLQANCATDIWNEILTTYHIDQPIGDQRFAIVATKAMSSETTAAMPLAAPLSTSAPSNDPPMGK